MLQPGRSEPATTEHAVGSTAEVPAAPGPDPAGRADGDASPIPAAIGKYLVVERFPRSGQAQVFRVVHPELRRDLVLKLANDPTGVDDRTGLVAEGQRLAGLEHPNIVRIHDLDFHEGRPYLVMEYIRGRTLAEYAREERVSPRSAAALVAEIAGAVAFAHRQGIVHQDIKPANVLIGEDGRPRLIDFGLASQHHAWTDSVSWSEGGTFAYMAPEQARVDLDRVRPLSDVFALGGLLYFLLVGKGPFQAESADASWERARRCDLDRSALMKAGIPRGLARICLEAMAEDPRSRHVSADAMRRALERYLLMRRAVPPLAALAVGLTLIVPAWAFWPGSATRSSEGTGRSSSGGRIAGPLPEPSPSATDGLRVLRFEIPHFPRLDREHYDPKRTGLLGVSSFAAREDDDVTVQAELSEPAYSYLIAFRPDGTDELCDPLDEDAPPVRKRQPAYPPPARSDERYRLSEGPGLYAFALVVSREALPPYREWKRRIGASPWAATLTAEPGVVWRDDDAGLQLLLADNAVGTRGTGAKARDSGGPAARMGSWLRGQPGVDRVILEAFPVQPASGR